MPNFKGFHSIDLARYFLMIQFSLQSHIILTLPKFTRKREFYQLMSPGSTLRRHRVGFGSTLDRHWVGIPMDSAGYRWWGISVGGDSDRIVLDTDRVFSVCAGYRWWGTSWHTRRTPAPRPPVDTLYGLCFYHFENPIAERY